MLHGPAGMRGLCPSQSHSGVPAMTPSRAEGQRPERQETKCDEQTPRGWRAAAAWGQAGVPDPAHGPPLDSVCAQLDPRPLHPVYINPVSRAVSTPESVSQGDSHRSLDQKPEPFWPRHQNLLNWMQQQRVARESWSLVEVEGRLPGAPDSHRKLKHVPRLWCDTAKAQEHGVFRAGWTEEREQMPLLRRLRTTGGDP